MSEYESKENNVILICVNEGKRLRVKILSPGYLPDANCQFPRSIREVGQKYSVKSSDIKLIQTRGKYFYSVKKNITILDETSVLDFQHIKIYEDTETIECIVCLENNKEIVFDPCGHFYTCSSCSNQLTKCPYCRKNITNKIDRNRFE
jgi:hypothetical protein